MANNRMYIHEKRTGNRFLLCKFYPSTSWYMFHTEEEFNQWLEAATGGAILQYKADSLFGPTSFELVFEHVEDGRDEPSL